MREEGNKDGSYMCTITQGLIYSFLLNQDHLRTFVTNSPYIMNREPFFFLVYFVAILCDVFLENIEFICHSWLLTVVQIGY